MASLADGDAEEDFEAAEAGTTSRVLEPSLLKYEPTQIFLRCAKIQKRPPSGLFFRAGRRTTEPRGRNASW
jgi:hypothetical protein